MTKVNEARWGTPDLQSLVDLFYPQPDLLGEFKEVPTSGMPDEYQKLLAHNAHMTVTLEEYHRSEVTVEVLDFQRTATHYSRKIVLRRISDQVPVLFGIVRLSLNFLPEHVQLEIVAQKTPLGRVLIQNNILRNVKLLTLWEVEPGEELTQLFSDIDHANSKCFGRTALIYCDGLPAVELLEIAKVKID